MYYENHISQPFYTRRDTNAGEKYDVRQILVVSDLHLSEGISEDGIHWHRRENFTFDEAFADFLAVKREEAGREGGPFWLIINGDFIDFLRITAVPKHIDDLPEEEQDLSLWRKQLEIITGTKLPDQQERVMNAFKECARQWQIYFARRNQPARKWPREVRHEIKYGLKTQDFKSIYRLMIARKGHARLFEALAQWLGEGHRLTIISGNHDQEFNQELLQAGLLRMLEDIYREKFFPEESTPSNVLVHENKSLRIPEIELALAGNNSRRGKNGYVRKAARRKLSEIKPEESAATVDFSNLLTFERDGLEIDGSIRIEHGHRFEWLTRAGEEWQEPEHREIQLAPGSLFNRYLINQVELEVPYLDNVKPSTRVIAYLAWHRPVRFLKILRNLASTTMQLARKKGVRELIYSGFLQAARIILPSAFSLWVLGYFLVFGNGAWAKILPISGFSEISLPLYITALAIVALLRLIKGKLKKLKLDFSPAEAKSEMAWGDIAAESSGKRYAIYGHTHQPDFQKWGNDIFHINSGTWTQVFDYEGGQVRDDITKNFIELTKTGGNWEGNLLRWNACHKCAENVILTNAQYVKRDT